MDKEIPSKEVKLTGIQDTRKIADELERTAHWLRHHDYRVQSGNIEIVNSEAGSPSTIRLTGDITFERRVKTQ